MGTNQTGRGVTPRSAHAVFAPSATGCRSDLGVGAALAPSSSDFEPSASPTDDDIPFRAADTRVAGGPSLFLPGGPPLPHSEPPIPAQPNAPITKKLVSDSIPAGRTLPVRQQHWFL